jgi:AraC-like DNA-binding protein
MVMKAMVHKSAIPDTKLFVVKELIAPAFDSNWHFHSEHQLFVVLEGTGTRFVGDSIKPFKESDMVFTGPNLPHLWRSEDAYFNKANNLRTHGIVIYFQENFLGDSLMKKEEMERIRVLLQKAVYGLEVKGETNWIITQMMKELVHLQGVPSLIQLLKILDILTNSPDCYTIAHSGYINQYKQDETVRMTKVYEYVMQNFRQKISLDEVAALANMTPSSFSRYFKARANKSFSNFVSEIRVGNACKLIHEQEMNIAQVSYECGFNTLSNFNKQFKEITGKNPLKYKDEYLKSMIDREP